VSPMATQPKDIEVVNTAEVRGDTLVVVNVKKRERSSMFKPTMTIPLDPVLGAQADPDIERKLWRAWVLGTSGEHCVPEPGVRVYNPRHYCAHKAIVIRLQEEGCERLVVEVEDPEGVLERINRAVRASARSLSLV
jgi:hypothetical protein